MLTYFAHLAVEPWRAAAAAGGGVAGAVVFAHTRVRAVRSEPLRGAALGAGFAGPAKMAGTCTGHVVTVAMATLTLLFAVEAKGAIGTCW